MNKIIPFRHHWTISELSVIFQPKSNEYPKISSKFCLKGVQNSNVDTYLFPNGFEEEDCENVLFKFKIELDRFLNLDSSCQFKLSIPELHFQKESQTKLSSKYCQNEKTSMLRSVSLFKQDYLQNVIETKLSSIDKITICFEGWIDLSEDQIEISQSSKEELVRNVSLSTDYFYGKFFRHESFAFKCIIENFNQFMSCLKYNPRIDLPTLVYATHDEQANFYPILIKFRDRMEFTIECNLTKKTNKVFVIRSFIMDVQNGKHLAMNHVYVSSNKNEILKINFDLFSLKNYSDILLPENTLTIFVKVTEITDEELKKLILDKQLDLNSYLGMLTCFDESYIKMTDYSIDAPKALNGADHRKTLPSLLINDYVKPKTPKNVSKSDRKQQLTDVIGKLTNVENCINQQTESFDQVYIKVLNINHHHKHYFENAKLDRSVVNTESKSKIEDITIQSDNCDSKSLIQQIQDIVNDSIKPILEQSQKTSLEVKGIQESLSAINVPNVKLDDLMAIYCEYKQMLQHKIEKKFTKMQRDETMKPSKVRKIMDQVILFLVKIKYELTNFAANIKSLIQQIQSSELLSEPILPETSNFETDFELNSDNIELHIGSVINFVQSLSSSSSSSIRNEDKEKNIFILEKIKTYFISTNDEFFDCV